GQWLAAGVRHIHGQPYDRLPAQRYDQELDQQPVAGQDRPHNRRYGGRPGAAGGPQQPDPTFPERRPGPPPPPTPHPILSANRSPTTCTSVAACWNGAT